MSLSSTMYAQKTITNIDNIISVGVKYYPAAITAKTVITANSELEALLYTWKYGDRVTTLYEIYGNIKSMEGLHYYYGPGAHLGFWNKKWIKTYPTRHTGSAVGVDGVVGLDYQLNNAPINISLDWQPSYNFISYNYFEGGWGGIAIRYQF